MRSHPSTCDCVLCNTNSTKSTVRSWYRSQHSYYCLVAKHAVNYIKAFCFKIIEVINHLFLFFSFPFCCFQGDWNHSLYHVSAHFKILGGPHRVPKNPVKIHLSWVVETWSASNVVAYVWIWNQNSCVIAGSCFRENRLLWKGELAFKPFGKKSRLWIINS